MEHFRGRTSQYYCSAEVKAMRWAVAVILLLAACAAGSAQEPAAVPSADRPITLELREAQISDALALLFRGGGRSYVLDSQSATPTTVTVSLKDVPWRRALQAVLEVANLTYRQEDNVYHIVARQARPTRPPVLEEARPLPPTTPAPQAPQGRAVSRTGRTKFELVVVRYADPGEMAAMFGGYAVGGGYGGGYNPAMYGLGGGTSSGWGSTQTYYSPGGYYAGAVAGPSGGRLGGYPGSYGGGGLGYGGYGGYGGGGLGSGGYGGYGGLGGYGGYGGLLGGTAVY
jgi:hypothetical protein